jgi:hypothetical protein
VLIDSGENVFSGVMKAEEQFIFATFFLED